MKTSNQHTISPAGLALIIASESLQTRAYLCPAGKLTIGYGHVILPRDFVYFKGQTAGSLRTITAECEADRRLTRDARAVLSINPLQAERLLQQDTQQVGEFINSVLPGGLTQSQFDALNSFVFNTGQGNFAASTLLKKLKAGDTAGAALEFGRWVYGTVQGKKTKLNGLVTRRAKERALFETP